LSSAFDIEFPHAQFLDAAIEALRKAVAVLPHSGAEESLLQVLEQCGNLGETLLAHRQLVYDVIKANQSRPVTDALLLLLGPSILKCKGAATRDNLSKLHYKVYARFAAGETGEIALDKKQCLRDGPFSGKRFGSAPVHVTCAGVPKRKVRDLEVVDNVKRRLTDPWNYRPLPAAGAQLSFVARERKLTLSDAALRAAEGGDIDWTANSAEEAARIQVAWTAACSMPACRGAVGRHEYSRETMDRRFPSSPPSEICQILV